MMSTSIDAPKVTPEQIAEYQPSIPEWNLIQEEGVDKLKTHLQN